MPLNLEDETYTCAPSEASIEAEKALSGDAPVRGPGQLLALPELVGRAFRVQQAAGRTVSELEVSQNDTITIERIRRNGKAVEFYEYFDTACVVAAAT